MKYNETSHIANLDEVKAFASYLINDLDVNIHPDNDFADYICTKTGDRTFTDKETAIGNRLMDECFEVCENEDVDIYEFLFPLIHSAVFDCKHSNE